jgi:hypothetical protein
MLSYEFDKLLDEAQDLWSLFKKHDVDTPDSVYYAALVGIILPHYHFVWSTYESAVDIDTAENKKPVYDPVDLINRLSHAR